jgi:hypothetical protein
VSADHLVSLLAQTLEQQSAGMVAARSQRAEVDHSRRLRDEQDEAFRASLQADATREDEARVAAVAAAEAAAVEAAAETEAAATAAAALAEGEERRRLIERRLQEKAAALREEPVSAGAGVCKLAGAYARPFRLNVSTFCGIRRVHAFPPVY